MSQSFYKNISVYAIAPQIPRVLNIFILPFLTAHLTAYDYGIQGIVYGYTASFWVLATLGIEIILANSFHQNPNHYQWVWRQIQGLLNYWNIIFVGLISILLYFVIPDHLGGNKWRIILTQAIPPLIFGVAATMGNVYLIHNQKVKEIALRTILAGILTVILNYYFIVVKKMGYMGWFYSGAIVTILTNITFFYYIFYIKKWRPIYKLKIKRIKNMLKVSLPIIPHFYSSYLLEASDRVVMQQMGVSESNIGKFNISYTLGTIVQGIVGNAGNALIPIYEYYKKQEYFKARRLIYSFIIIFLLFTSLVSLWSKEIFYILIKNEELAKMYPLSIIIIMAFNYRTLYYGAVNIAFFKKNTTYIWTLSLSAGIINIILNIIFIPIYGFEAAAYTTFIAYMYLGAAGYYFNFYKQSGGINYYPLFWVFLFIFVTYLLIYAVEFNWMFKGGITLVILLSVIFYYLFIKRQNKYEYNSN